MLEINILRLNRLRFRLASSSRARLWRRICSLSRAGVPIATAIDFLHDSNTSNSVCSRFIEHQRTALRSAGFASGAAGWVPQEELTIIEVTQEGRIADGFEQASRIATVRSKLRTTLISGLSYPSILLLVGGAVIAVLPAQALSFMLEIVSVSKWPPVSRSVLAFSEFVSVWGVPAVSALVAVVGLSFWAAPRWSGPMRQRMDWFPVFALYRQFTAPEILSAWLALMQAGVQRIRALAELEKGLPVYLASHVRIMRSRLYRGEPVETALNTGLFSAETLDDIRIYERTGDFDVNAELIAEEEINRALTKLQSMTKTLSSLLLLLIGCTAIWIYVGIARVALTVQQSAF